jgi:hypothetical protein
MYYKQISAKDVAKKTNLEFEVSFTQRNDTINYSSYGANYFIFHDGLIYVLNDASGQSAKILVVGGLNTFVNQKTPRPEGFYLSTGQKQTLSDIMYFLSRNSDANITSNSDMLQRMLEGEYNNFRG